MSSPPEEEKPNEQQEQAVAENVENVELDATEGEDEKLEEAKDGTAVASEEKEQQQQEVVDDKEETRTTETEQEAAKGEEDGEPQKVEEETVEEEKAAPEEEAKEEAGKVDAEAERQPEESEQERQQESVEEKVAEEKTEATGVAAGNDDDVTGTTTDNNQKKATVEGLPLDWTQLGVGADEAVPLRYPHDVAKLNKDDLDICVVGTAGQKITVMGKDFSERCNPNLEQLILRSHLIQHIEGLENFAKLELLELYDNMVQELQCLEVCGPNLRVLDMSYNSIRQLSPVSICTNLTELYIANNKLKEIQGLDSLTKLRKIDLGANRIRVLQNLDGLVNLEELWIGKNKIEKIQGLEKLTKLRQLDIQSNRLTKIENLQAQKDTLEELYLAHNGIDNEGASSEEGGLAMTFPNLNVLDLSRNRLTSCSSFAHQPAIEELWLSGNQMESFDAILPLKDSAAAGIQQLETLYLEYNPVASEFEYRKRLAEWIPCLKQIDANLIGGLAAHGFQSVPTTMNQPPLAEQLRQYQAAALDRAKEESKET